MKQDMTQDRNYTFMKTLRGVLVATMMLLTSGNVMAQVRVNGSVYGGGNAADVGVNATVNITHGTVSGSVYGGGFGETTVVTGNVEVNIGKKDGTTLSGDATITGDVYGGSAKGKVNYNKTNAAATANATTKVNIYGTSSTGDDSGVRDVYGGGHGLEDNPADVYGVVTVTVEGGKARNVYGCNNLKGSPQLSVEVNIKGGTISEDVFGGGHEADALQGITVNISGGEVRDVYGGGALASTNTANWDATADGFILATGLTVGSSSVTGLYTKSGETYSEIADADAKAEANKNYYIKGAWSDATNKSAKYKTNVKLTGGTVGNAYGGGLGNAATPAYVWGDVLVDLNGTTTYDTGGKVLTTPITAKGCIVVNSIFGCNNVNGTPKGEVLVHVHATQTSGKETVSAKSDKNTNTYDVQAVYGGGNQAEYYPVNAMSDNEATKASAHTNVIIDGCTQTSIQNVYGGGNAASTPSTSVTVNGAYEIGEVFGGGNGFGDGNPGANVGFHDYSTVEDQYPTKKERQMTDFTNTYVYGSGKASVNIFGGTVHRVFGGSNTKGNVRVTAITMLEDQNGCDFHMDEAYGGGKSAPMDAEAKLHMACIPGLRAAYGGAEAADVLGDVTLNITNGTFDRVFGGNNLSGTISGSITVNIEETGCKPIIIGELYGGGNQAAYSVFGYKTSGATHVIRTSKDDDTAFYTPSSPYSEDQLFADPQVNVKSFTSIGKIYGGGLGTTATMVGNPTVNVSVAEGAHKTTVIGDNAKTYSDDNGKPVPSHAEGKIGAINNVYGGGNAADVVGNTNVNIGTDEYVYVTKEFAVGASVANYYIRTGAGTAASPYAYTSASGTATENETYYERQEVVGVDIRGNVYGGGEGSTTTVTGNVVVNIGGQKTEGTTTTFIGGNIAIGGSVYGGSALGAVNATRGTGSALTPTANATTAVTLKKGTVIRYVFGGGQGNSGTKAHVYGKSTVTLYGDVVAGGLYGGCDANGEMHSDTQLDLLGGTVGQNTAPNADILFGGGLGKETTVDGDVTVNVGKSDYTGNTSVTIWGNVYGGGALGSVNTDKNNTTLVNLFKGTVNGNVFGGGLGQAAKAAVGEEGQPGYEPAVSEVAAEVKGNVTVKLNENDGTCEVTGSIFGCNNTKGSPEGHVLVHVFKTAPRSGQGENDYDLAAVYGGGNNADYDPTDTEQSAEVIIEGCANTSIQNVYGGGNAAAVPATEVWILGAKKIDEVFGGGNGEAGAASAAHVGFHRTSATSKTDYADGDGKTYVKLVGGTINTVYGGSNSNGDIRGGSDISMPTMAEYTGSHTGATDPGNCTLKTTNIYGGGKNADMSGGTSIVLGCMPDQWIDEIYAGAKNADVAGDVNLTITSGKFYRVFGGNKDGGLLKGSITVNIEETGGCDVPIVIGELYGGGNLAGYSVYGYYQDASDGNKWKPRTKAQYDTWFAGLSPDEKVKPENQKYNEPQLNIRAFTSIGTVYGGGYQALMIADPHVDINVVKGSKAATAFAEQTIENVPIKKKNASGNIEDVTITLHLPAHEANKIGAIEHVFGGGNLATVDGSATVNIGTETEIDFASTVTHLTENGNEKYDVEGAIITGNVYGGGNQADVTGDTQVNICAKEVTVGENKEWQSVAEGASKVIINGDVFGAGKGLETDVKSALVKGNSFVYMGGGWVKSTIYGGGELASVGDFTYDANNVITACGGNSGTASVNIFGGKVGPTTLTMPMFDGHVFGAGKGISGANDLYPKLNFVENTSVTISGTAFVKGSVYGGSENGHVRGNTNVTISGGQIGCGYDGSTGGAGDLDRVYTDEEWAYDPTSATNPLSLYECNSWTYGKAANANDKYAPYDPYANDYDAKGGRITGDDGHTFYGNVFGGGSGYFPYAAGQWLMSAGSVGGNTTVTITGGHILTNIYGGNELTNVVGTSTVNFGGNATLGVPRTLAEIAAHPLTCYLFGGGKGDQRVLFNKDTNVGNAVVNITGGWIYGSVFGGGEDGHVLCDVTMTIGKDDHTGPTIGTWGTSYVDGNIFGGGRGFGGDAYTAGNVAGSVDVDIKGGNILGSIYGGGRLASVGYGLYLSNEAGYGEMREDTKYDDGTDGSSFFKNGRGHVDITISGGTIGNDLEYKYNPTAEDLAKMPLTEFGTDGRLKHTKGGNVFAGGMGRLYQLDGTTPISSVDWWRLGNVKQTKLTITGGTIKSCVYGGGELGAVNPYVNGETVQGGTTEIIIQNANNTIIGTEVKDGEDTKYTFGSVYGGGSGSTVEKLFATDDPATENDNPKFIAGLVHGNTKVDMQGGKVLASVYGGGEVASVNGSTDVAVSGGSVGKDKVGTTYFGGATMGNVYGGGSGHGNIVRAGRILKNTKVTISGADTKIYHNVYGGGAYGTVGDFNYTTSTEDGKVIGVNSLKTAETGKAEVIITGGTIGVDGHENGLVFGSSRGDVNKPGERDDHTAWVYDAFVTIGTQGSETGPAIKGSVYGSGENGHTFHDTDVKIHSGVIGVAEDASYLYRGNVYGGGCGTDKYYSTGTELFDGNGDKYNPLAGIVYGNTSITIDGGTVVHNVYGAGAMGSVGKTDTDGSTTGGKTTLNISGGTIGVSGTVSDGYVYGAARGDLSDHTAGLAEVQETEVNIKPNTIEGKPDVSIKGSVFGGGEAGIVKGSVAVNMTGGTVDQDVYGGGALANTNTDNWDATKKEGAGGWAEGKTSASHTTIVNLLGGSIGGDAYGGGLGRLAKEAVSAQPAQGTEGEPDYVPAVEAQAAVSAVEAKVYGDVTVTLGDADKTNATAFNISNYTGDHADVIKSGRVFGCNNLNGSPKGNVTVTVNKTVKGNTARTAEDPNKEGFAITDNSVPHTYELAAVYGGGNLADYTPAGTDKKTIVRIMTCDVSVQEVYGGGNAAVVPETDVLVNGAYEIAQVFGGGNGEDAYYLNEEWHENPGANVGGDATTLLTGGYIHEAYGGSNSKGTITGNINISKGTGGECTLNVVELYGAGKDADVEGDLIMVMGCSDTRTERVYGCAKNANVKGNVELTITSGEYGKVFGGNNESGAIFGHIIINVEEIGCTRIIIDELYGCGNDAAYSVYGYWENGTIAGTDKPKYEPIKSLTDPNISKRVTFADYPHTDPANNPSGQYDDPEINIVSCTRIGKVFGGGYGAGATVYGNPKVNINMMPGKYASDGQLGQVGCGYTDANKETVDGGIFGGGNAARVEGNATVNIGNMIGEQVEIAILDANGNPVKDNDGNYTYTKSEETTVTGANIAGNVYGGGKLADVTGNTFVNICAKYDNETEKFVAVAEGTSGVTIGGNVFGGGEGEAAESGDDAFLCARAMIGINNDGIANPDGGTTIIIGNGTVNGNVYGGGMVGRVEKNTVVTIGLEGTTTSKPEIKGNVYGGGQGEKHHGYAGLVRGNPTVTIQGNAKVRKSVYGGGEIASVARYKVAEDQTEAAAHGVEEGMPYVLTNANSGKCTVTIKGNAEIGPDYAMKMYHSEITDGTDKPDDFGHVFGAGKGILPEVFTYADDNNKPYRIDNNGDKEYYNNEDGYFGFIRTLALSTETDVTIDGNAFVKGSVYGGSENGLVQYDTNVTINSGQIGCGDGVDHRYSESDWSSESLAECAHWDYGLDTNDDGKKDLFAPYDPNANATGDLDKYPKVDAQSEAKSTEGGRRIATDGHTYYGNVFGGGSGSVPYFDTQQGISRYISTAGEVKGNTHVTISGGHILTNVYGGNESTNVLGTAHVTMTGGTVGVPRTAEQIKNHPVTCYVFGAGKGDQRIFFNKETNVNDAIVTITGGRIYGSVFGGGEDGHVLRNTTVTIGDNGTGPNIGTTGTTYVDGNVFGGGRGFGGDALTAGNVGGAVDLTINGGTMLGSIYGGGRLASVGYGLYLVDEEVGGVKPYGVMREDNEYDGSYPNPSTEAASDFYNKGRGHITITVNGGTIGNVFENETEGAEHSGNVFGGSMGRLTKLDGTPFDANHWKLLATAKSATVNVTGGTIKRNVYGGGEMGTVTTNTTVNISGGTIGTTGKGADNYGNVYGGGKGLETEILAGIVKGNSNVTISDGTILHNVYGGGAYGSVGTFTISNDMRTFTWGDPYNETGVSNVTISGGTIGEDALNGNVFGGGRGVANTFWCEKGIAYKANVNISNGMVKGNVYGGGEVGRVESDTEVKIGNGAGSSEGTAAPTIKGSVFGGGAGLVTHGYSALIRGNTAVTVEGNATVENSVYGGGEIASVGKYGLNAEKMPNILLDGGRCIVTVQGYAVVGPNDAPDTKGNVFGAGKGVDTPYDNSNKPQRMTLDSNNNSVYETIEEDDYSTYLETLALVTHPEVTIDGHATVNGSVFGGGELGLTKGSVIVTINGGTMEKDVYGGGALANTNTTHLVGKKDANGKPLPPGEDGIYQTEEVYPTTEVNLTGGLIKGDAYGGGLGQKDKFNGATSDIEATVYGDITVNLGDAGATKATTFNITYEDTDEKDEANNSIQVVKSGRVFGCNNLNGSPQGNVTVNVYKTVAGNVTRTAADPENPGRANRSTDVEHKYEVAAVYGGGNLANYSATGKKAGVTIHTCDVSVQHVYGGGNAAAVPETDVLVKGAWEIDQVFGGGNGKDKYKKGDIWQDNEGANVNGNTNTLLIGGYIHEAYGGSNEKGTITGNVSINTNSEREDCACALELIKLYGAGKNADIEGDMIVVLGCAPETKTEEIYGGAENANVKGNVELTITSGTFGKVFGGNNQSGAIFGHIILNIEETSCRPIVIDELYGCGNNATYSVYGYKYGNDGNQIYVPRTSSSDGTAVKFDGKPHTDPGNLGYDNPEVNIISCTKIGKVFGGGLGSGGTVYGNPTVNINMIPGAFAAQIDRDGDGLADKNSNALGEIGDVFGGGNEANVVGNTNVNIGTKDKVWLHQSVDDNGNYTMSPALTESGISVVGANITGNVYGGGNAAEVTGNTNVVIGKDATTPSGSSTEP